MKNFRVVVRERGLESEFELEAETALVALRTVTANMFESETVLGDVISVRIQEVELKEVELKTEEK